MAYHGQQFVNLMRKNGLKIQHKKNYVSILKLKRNMIGFIMKYSAWMLLAICILASWGCSDSNDSKAKGKQKVEYTDKVGQNDIGLPKTLNQPQQTTKIEIKIKVPFRSIKDNKNITTTIDTDNAASLPPFNPSTQKSFKISHEDLVVTTSGGQKLPIVFYFRPILEDRKKFQFQVFATLDGISYNTVGLNQAQTAYTVRNMYSSEVMNAISQAPYWNPKNKELAPSKLERSTVWQAGSIMLRILPKPAKPPKPYVQQFFIQHKPGQTIMPCYKPLDACLGIEDAEDAAQRNKNMKFEEIVFQPLGPMNYPSIDWSSYTFSDKQLAAYDPLSGIKPGAALIKKAQELTREELNRSRTPNHDIGWFGLSPDLRNNNQRYHLVSLKIIPSVIPVTGSKSQPQDKLVIEKDGITIDNNGKPTTLTTAKQEIDFQVDSM